MAISGASYLVLETVLGGDGPDTTDLAAKPNRYLGRELAEARAHELAAAASLRGEARAFWVQRSAGSPRPISHGQPAGATAD